MFLAVSYFSCVSCVVWSCSIAAAVRCRFSPAQAELYEAVLEVQMACLSLCTPGVSLDYIYTSMLSLLARQLRRLGIVSPDTNETDTLKVLLLLFFTHFIEPVL